MGLVGREVGKGREGEKMGPKGKKIGVVGSRQRNSTRDFELLKEELEKWLEPGDELVSGGASKGGDRFAEILAQRLGVRITIHRANWDEDGRGAGMKRNGLVVRDSDMLIALVKEGSRGTEDVVRKFRKAKPEGVVVEL